MNNQTPELKRLLMVITLVEIFMAACVIIVLLAVVAAVFVIGTLPSGPDAAFVPMGIASQWPWLSLPALAFFGAAVWRSSLSRRINVLQKDNAA